MTQVVATLRECWQKNWPEVHAAITGGLPEFIFARHPRELGSTVPVFCYHTADAQRFERDLDFLSGMATSRSMPTRYWTTSRNVTTRPNERWS